MPKGKGYGKKKKRKTKVVGQPSVMKNKGMRK